MRFPYWHKIVEKVPALERVSPSSIVDTMDQMPPRERKLIMAAVTLVFFAVLFMIFSSSQSKLKKLNQRLDSTEKTLQQVQALAQQAQNNSSKSNAFMSKIRPATGFYLASFVQDQAARYQIELSDLSTESRKELENDIEEVSVDVKINNVEYGQMLSFLSELERTNNALLRIKRLRIKTVPTEPIFVELSFKVSAYLRN